MINEIHKDEDIPIKDMTVVINGVLNLEKALNFKDFNGFPK